MNTHTWRLSILVSPLSPCSLFHLPALAARQADATNGAAIATMAAERQAASQTVSSPPHVVSAPPGPGLIKFRGTLSVSAWPIAPRGLHYDSGIQGKYDFTSVDFTSLFSYGIFYRYSTAQEA